jgi:hypothetical protein
MRDPGFFKKAGSRFCSAPFALLTLRCARDTKSRIRGTRQSMSLRSRQFGFSASISLNFQSRRQRFNMRSRARASRMEA